MQTSEEETKFIRFMKWLQSNFTEIYLSLEPMLLLLVGILLAEEVLEFYKQPQISLETNYELLFIPALGLLAVTFRLLAKERGKQLEAKADKYDQQSIDFNEIRSELSYTQEAISILKTERLEDAINISSSFLEYIFNQLKLTHNERLSAYMIVTLENQEEYLQIFGRYSKHYEHNKLRRKRFPKDQGVIGRAFVNGEYNEVFFPENEEDYFEKCKEFGILKKDAKEIRMKSKSFYPFVINNTSHSNNKNVIILLESMTLGYQFNKKDMEDFLINYPDFIKHLLQHSYNMLEATQTEGKL